MEPSNFLEMVGVARRTGAAYREQHLRAIVDYIREWREI